MMTIVLRSRRGIAWAAPLGVAALALSAVAVGAFANDSLPAPVGVTQTASRLVSNASPDVALGRTFYLSCRGDDANDGTAPSRAWKSLARAEQAELLPGDSLRLQRGCTWSGDRLDIDWSGSPEEPIVVASYGAAGQAAPLIRNGKNSNIKITGSHLVVRELRSHFDPFNQIACGQSIGNVYGFNLTGGASHVVLDNNETSGATAGVHLSRNSGHITVSDNFIHDNGVLTSFGANPAQDLGAWGILVRSDDNLIEGNSLVDNRATCRNQGYKLMSNSIEIYEGSNNVIRNNRARGDRVFSELGSSATRIASGNVFERNVFISDAATSRFITTRGPRVKFGPVEATRVLHNTTYQTAADSEGVVCGGGCDATILDLRNNIMHAEKKAIFADGAIGLGPNVVWNSSGDPFVQIKTLTDDDASFILADPRFENAARGDLRLEAGSPAIDAADSGSADIGALER